MLGTIGRSVAELAFAVSVITASQTVTPVDVVPSLERCPVAVVRSIADEPAALTFADDWGAPRSGGRSHRGTDMFAPRGSQVVAPFAGVAWSATDRLGGNVVFVAGHDGSVAYMAHLDAWADLVTSTDRTAPVPVAAGDVVGTVGTSGNATDTPPHLHFGWYPHGPVGGTANPYLLLGETCATVPKWAELSWMRGTAAGLTDGWAPDRPATATDLAHLTADTVAVRAGGSGRVAALTIADVARLVSPHGNREDGMARLVDVGLVGPATAPGAVVTMAGLVVIVDRLGWLPPAVVDVPAASLDAMGAAVKAGVVAATSPGSGPVDRAEVAAVLHGLGLLPDTTDRMVPAGAWLRDVPDWARQGMQVAVGTGMFPADESAREPVTHGDLAVVPGLHAADRRAKVLRYQLVDLLAAGGFLPTATADAPIPADR